jgi:hypothetical protein
VCPACGFYENRMVIDVRARRRREEQEPQTEGESTSQE